MNVNATLPSGDNPDIKGKSVGQIICSLFRNEMYDHKDAYFNLNIKQPSAEYFSLPRLKKWFL